MTTLVGMQDKFTDALKSLIELDMATVKVYEEAIEYLKTENYKQALQKFKENHEQHVSDLSDVLRRLGEELPTSGGVKELCIEGKIIFANLLGDRAILKAIKSNENDTNTAYARVNNHKEKTDEATDILKQCLEDGHKHCYWIEKTLKE